MRLSFRRGAGSQRTASRGQSVVEFALVLPLMVILLLAIVDFARIHTTAMSVESAARSGDFGTSFGAEKWDATNSPITLEEMETRSCIAASTLPDYAGVDPSSIPPDDPVTCTNPSFSYCVTTSVGGPCGALDPVDVCEDPNRTTPCAITVNLDLRLPPDRSVQHRRVRHPGRGPRHHRLQTRQHVRDHRH